MNTHDKKKELYHGSSKKLDVIIPHKASHGQSFVYASPDYLFALCYAGAQWDDFEINQSYYNGELYLTEIQRGKFKECFMRPGYVHHLDSDDFRLLPGEAGKELVSKNPVAPVSVDEIPNVYRELVSRGVHMYAYPNLPPFIKDRNQYVINKGLKLGMDRDEQLLRRITSYFPYLKEELFDRVNKIHALSTTVEGTIEKEIDPGSITPKMELVRGLNIKVASDWHLFEYDKREKVCKKKKDFNEIIRNAASSINKDDIFIFLGDLTDAEFTDASELYGIFSKIPAKVKILIRGLGDDFLSDDDYKKIGFDIICTGAKMYNLLFTHESSFTKEPIINIHGHDHGKGHNADDAHYDVWDAKCRVRDLFDIITPPCVIPSIKITDNEFVCKTYDGTKDATVRDIVDLTDNFYNFHDYSDSVMKESSEEMTVPDVYFTRDITPQSLINLYHIIADKKNLSGNVMVKISSGEPGGNHFLQPDLIGPLVNSINGTICDANTAYAGPRQNTETHYQVMQDHGFADIAPVDVLDAEGEIEIPVNDGYYLKTLPVGSHNSRYGTFLILSHFKGHAMAGFGGAMKNVAIGMASKRGKAIVHSGGASETEIFGHDQQVFLKSMVDSLKASIDYGGRENFIYINVANNLSVDCDCDAHPAAPTMKDIGVFASTDPLAIDQACIDAVDKASDNKDLVARIKRQTGRNILKYAEEAEVGSRKYNLIDLDKDKEAETTNESFSACQTLRDAVGNVFPRNALVAIHVDGQTNGGTACQYAMWDGEAHRIPDEFLDKEILEISDVIDDERPGYIHVVVDYPEPMTEDKFALHKFDAAMHRMYEGSNDPPHSEETPYQSNPIQTTTSDHSFIGNGEPDDFEAKTTNESVIFNKKDIALNEEKWRPEKGHNILFITGLSGSGKSTLAEEYERKFNAHMFELDGLEHRYDSSGSAKILDKVREKCPGYDEYFKDRSKKVKDCINDLFDAADEALKIMKEDYKTLYIIEGVQLFDGLYPDSELKGKPLIIKNTSHLTSIVRALKRTAQYDEVSMAKAIRDNLSEILAYHRRSYKPFKEFKNKFKNESVDDLTELFESAIRSFSNEYKPVMEVAIANETTPDFAPRKRRSLGSFRRVECQSETQAKPYIERFHELQHVRTDGDFYLILWLDDRDLVAYVNMNPRGDKVMIQSLEVTANYKASGLGTQVLRYAERAGANLLYVNKKNEVAQHMYKKAGWRIRNKCSTENMLQMVKESAGVMQFLPYVGVKKDPPPNTDYEGSPFKALEESYETVFEFKNEAANECVLVKETKFSPSTLYIEAGNYHYPDVIKELVEDVITDIQNGSEDYSNKDSLVWHITGENAEPLCAVADELGFIRITNIKPDDMDTVTYGMDIRQFTPEKTQLYSEAATNTNIFRADEEYIYLDVPYCEFYIPTAYFAAGKKFAEDFTDKIHVIGLFNIGIFDNDKLKDIRVFNVPVYLDINVYDYDVRMIDLGSGTPVECRVYKYYQDSIITRAFIQENSGVAQSFLQLIISGNMPSTIPYNQTLSVWRKNLELSGVNLGVSSSILEMILAVMYRDGSDPSKKYCIKYGSSATSSEYDYMSASIRQICQYNSTFTGIIYEDIDSMITTAINRNRSGKDEGESPLEKIMKM